MKLLRARIDGFGQFNQGLDVAFDPDRLNLIVGRNEAGKSTLMNAICGVLFGFRDLNVVRRYEPWGEHRAYAGMVELAADDGRHIRLSRDFRAATAEIIEISDEGERVLFSGSADPRGTTADDALFSETLGAILGIQDESVFRNTVFVGQLGLRTEVSDQIRRLLSGSAATDYKGALHELHSRHAELTGENPWRTGGRRTRRALEESKDSLAGARERLARGRLDLNRHAALEDETDLLARRQSEHLAASTGLQAAIATTERIADLTARLDDAARRLSDTTRRRATFREHREQLQTVEDHIRATFAHFRGMGDDFPELVAAFAAETAEHTRESERLAQAEQELAALKPKPNTRLGAMLGGALAAVSVGAGFLTPLTLIPGLVAGAVLGAVGLTVGRQVGTGYRAQRDGLAADVHDLTKSVRARERRLDEITAATGNLLVGRSTDVVAAEWRAYRAAMDERRRLQGALKALGDGESIETAWLDAGRDLTRLEATLAELLVGATWIPQPIDAARVQTELTRLRAERGAREAVRERERQRIEEARVELAQVAGRLDVDLPRLEDQVRQSEAHVRHMDTEKDALKQAIDMLDTCIKDFQENDVFRLADEMSVTFARITDNKYDRVHLGPSLEPLVSSGDRHGIRPEDLSQGAHDQLYFALRIALVRHLSRNVRLPIFLDDPFVNFDAERLAVTRDVLKALPDHQVIMVTCDREYESWTDAIIDLDKARVG